MEGNTGKQRTWTIHDLGALVGDDCWANRINADGRIIVAASIDNESKIAYLWTPRNGMRPLGSFGGSFTDPKGINAAGHIVGYSQYPGDAIMRAFLWIEENSLLDLGTLGGEDSHADDINDLGHVVGYAKNATGECCAFIWTPEQGMRDIGTLGGEWAEAYSINNAGQVVGRSVNQQANDRPFLWTPEAGMIDLGTLGGDEGYAEYLNNLGQVVGYTDDAEGNTCAFLWTAANGMQNLGTLGGVWSHAHCINDLGQIVGVSQFAELPDDPDNSYGIGHAFVWSPANGMIDLGALGGNDSAALGINNAGQIVGWSYLPDGSCHAVLWEPLTR